MPMLVFRVYIVYIESTSTDIVTASSLLLFGLHEVCTVLTEAAQARILPTPGTPC